MGKYDQLKYLKKTKARVSHQCSHCGDNILVKEYYYKEALRDKFLQLLNARCFCVKCYEQFGESLLTLKSKKKLTQNEKSKKLSDFV
jgi:hypothetical protein